MPRDQSRLDDEAHDISVTLLGLWDTVGPLGIPTNALKWLNEHRYNFRDTELSPILQRAYHALAIDEHRADHNATLWTAPPKAGQIIEQRWFEGLMETSVEPILTATWLTFHWPGCSSTRLTTSWQLNQEGYPRRRIL